MQQARQHTAVGLEKALECWFAGLNARCLLQLLELSGNHLRPSCCPDFLARSSLLYEEVWQHQKTIHSNFLLAWLRNSWRSILQSFWSKKLQQGVSPCFYWVGFPRPHYLTRPCLTLSTDQKNSFRKSMNPWTFYSPGLEFTAHSLTVDFQVKFTHSRDDRLAPWEYCRSLILCIHLQRWHEFSCNHNWSFPGAWCMRLESWFS